MVRYLVDHGNKNGKVSPQLNEEHGQCIQYCCGELWGSIWIIQDANQGMYDAGCMIRKIDFLGKTIDSLHRGNSERCGNINSFGCLGDDGYHELQVFFDIGTKCKNCMEDFALCTLALVCGIPFKYLSLLQHGSSFVIHGWLTFNKGGRTVEMYGLNSAFKARATLSISATI